MPSHLSTFDVILRMGLTFSSISVKLEKIENSKIFYFLGVGRTTESVVLELGTPSMVTRPPTLNVGCMAELVRVKNYRGYTGWKFGKML